MSTAASTAETLKAAARQRFCEIEVTSDVKDKNFSRSVFIRVTAKRKTFTGVVFKYCSFDDCYFRDCTFVRCDFTGAQIRNTVLRGAKFEDSHFDYCRFFSSTVPQCILASNMPGYENVALELARSLRTNYSQVGDSDGVNRAISAEVHASRVHFRKAAWSSEGYYRSKYKGLRRVGCVGQHILYELQSHVWGNGESVLKVIRCAVFLYAMLFLWCVVRGAGWGAAAVDALALFSGTYRGTNYSVLYPFVTALRFVLMGLFVAVVVRRLSHR